MSISEIIHNRRTIKPEEFNGHKINNELFHTILESANWAPTHGYTEPWRFVVFDDPKKFGQLHADLYQKETSAEQFLQKKYDTILHKPDLASHIIVVVMKRGQQQNIPEIEELAATACAAQNILLTASAHEVAAYWGTGGMCYHPSMKAHFGFGEEDKIMGFLYLGYTDKVWPEGQRNSTIEEKTTWIG